MTLDEVLAGRTNDYSELEQQYRQVTGEDLIRDPTTAPNTSPDITHSASVVIAAWNAQQTIRQCLTAIELSSFNLRYGPQLEVVVVDDGSSDATWDILRNLKLNLNIKLIRQQNTGQYRAINTALNVAEGDIIVSCDDDMILTTFAIEELMKRHEILERVLLLGFRYDIARDDPRLEAHAIAEHLSSFPLLFEQDNRLTFHWPGWPENLCAETGHLRMLNGAQRIFVTDGESPDGDYWDLPRMVYGVLFSMSREDYLALGGYDEELAGWGFGDTLLGAEAYALGNFIIPVYDAVGLHVAHADRSATKWDEAEGNLVRLAQRKQKPAGARSTEHLSNRKIREQLQSSHVNGSATQPERKRFHDSAERRGARLLALGQYSEAVDVFAGVEDERLRRASQGRAFVYLSKYEQAAECFEACTRVAPEHGEAHARLALTRAALGLFKEGKLILEQAGHLRERDGWLRYLLDNNAEAHASRGRRYLKERFFRWAVRDFEAALLHEPDNVSLARERDRALKNSI